MNEKISVLLICVDLIIYLILYNLHETTFKHKSHKMVKPTQIIRRLLSTKRLSVFHQFVGLTLKGLILLFSHFERRG